MKRKELSKKFQLSKVTLANLNDPQLQAILGGAPLTSEPPGNACKTQCNTGYCCYGITLNPSD